MSTNKSRITDAAANQVRPADTARATGREDLVIAAPPVQRGINRRFFFDTARLLLFDGKLTPLQVQGMEEILNRWELEYGKGDDRHLAYMLATAHHETDRKMQPIDEYGKGAGKIYGKRIKQSGAKYTDTTAIFYGRGLVQLTWWENYRTAGLALYGNARVFLDNPDKVKEGDNDTRIMFRGMMEGWFTSKKLSDYFSPAKEDWVNARRIINGLDKAETVASYARKYYAAISYTTA